MWASGTKIFLDYKIHSWLLPWCQVVVFRIFARKCFAFDIASYKRVTICFSHVLFLMQTKIRLNLHPQNIRSM